MTSDNDNLFFSNPSSSTGAEHAISCLTSATKKHLVSPVQERTQPKKGHFKPLRTASPSPSSVISAANQTMSMEPVTSSVDTEMVGDHLTVDVSSNLAGNKHTTEDTRYPIPFVIPPAIAEQQLQGDIPVIHSLTRTNLLDKLDALQVKVWLLLPSICLFAYFLNTNTTEKQGDLCLVLEYFLMDMFHDNKVDVSTAAPRSDKNKHLAHPLWVHGLCHAKVLMSRHIWCTSDSVFAFLPESPTPADPSYVLTMANLLYKTGQDDCAMDNVKCFLCDHAPFKQHLLTNCNNCGLGANATASEVLMAIINSV